ncbi:esterase/lipase family protein [Altererythrobacter sp.]|uniref:esterase/lipase family protein n=1 Tax=Altererythrobacter sp. TaxID=1872480 RepID=UPI003CFDD7B8
MSEVLSSLRENAQTRIELAREPRPEEAAGAPPLRLLLGEALTLAEPLARKLRPPLDIVRSDNPQIVVLLPGFATHPLRMRYMARQIERAGHKVKNWGLGFNMGPSEEIFDHLSSRIDAVHARYGKQVVLVGWSLGGLYARELAKRHPDLVAKVITMGSPFSQSPYANNVWRIYQFVTGHSVAAPPIKANMAEKPPVETVALWSPRDGAISPRAACGLPGERDRAIALRCTHMGFSKSPEAILTVLRELENTSIS